ncbi:putative MFS family arabinose efflux permease [Nocardia pseudobrasiliensis]|uniref:Putative MFS family arabinose efflux permease n=1 Tax=Nocardia pseudobrasiliensis TaxID=45979 RepID=A0A370IEL1_9NOCA|nr:putative MFS family arabinose efflux permease [Nocardia pseudobrasiliensis]
MCFREFVTALGNMSATPVEFSAERVRVTTFETPTLQFWPSGVRARRERRTLALVTIALLSCVQGLDTAVHSVALPGAREELDMGPGVAATAAGIGALVSAACILAVGMLGDRTGRRRMLLCGGLAVALGSMLTAFAPDSNAFLLGRALTGMGVAATVVTALALVSALYFRHELPWVFGVWLGIQAVGVMVGGIGLQVVSSETPWRNGYLVMAWIALALAVLGWLAVPDSRPAGPRRFDTGGVIFGAVALVAALVAVGRSVDYRWNSPGAFGTLALSVLAFSVFVRWERRRGRPAFPVALLDSLPFVAACLAGVVFAFAETVYLRQTAALLADYVNGPVLTVALALVPLSLGMLLGAVLAGQAQENGTSARAVLASGLMCCGLGSLILIFVAERTELWLYAAAGALIGFGLMWAQNAQSVLIVSAVPPTGAGAVAAAKFGVAQLGYALGLSTLPPIVASFPVTAPVGSVQADVHRYTGAMFVTSVVVFTAALGVTIMVSGNLARVVVRTPLPHRLGSARPVPIRLWYRGAQLHGEQALPQTQRAASDQFRPAGAAVEIGGRPGKVLEQLGFRIERLRRDAGGGDDCLAVALDRFVQRRGNAVELREGQVFAQEPVMHGEHR